MTDLTCVASVDDAEQRYRFLTENIPVQVWTALPDGRLDYVSDQTARALGMSSEQLLAHGWQHVVHPDDLRRAIDQWNSALASGSVYELEFRLKGADGAYLWHLARAVPQRDGTGKIVRWFGTNTNVDEHRKREQKIRELSTELRERAELLALEVKTQALLVDAATAKDAAQATAEALLRHLEAPLAGIWTTKGKGLGLELLGCASSSSGSGRLPSRQPSPESALGRAFAEQRPQVTSDFDGRALGIDPEWAARHGVRTLTACPVLFGADSVGVLAVLGREPPSDAAVHALQGVAHAFALALERFRVRDELRLSELWLSTTLSSIGDGVIATNADGQVRFMNPVASVLTGWAPDEAFGRHLDTILPIVNEHTRAKVESPVTKVLREGGIVGMANHTLLLRRDGNELPIEDSAAPIRDHDGTLTGVVLVFRDAREKREFESERAQLLGKEETARREAEAARAALHSLFMHAPTPICILEGPDHVFSLVNHEYSRLLGTHRQLLGLSIREALPDGAGEAFFELLDRVYTTGERFVGREVPIVVEQAGNGERHTKFMNFVYETFRDAEDRIAGILVIAFDVSETLLARRELQSMFEERGQLLAAAEEARARADLASNAKDEFLATASHELRTPLTAILGWARLLHAGRLDAKNMSRGLETIERNASAQVKLIEDILDGSRIITGKLKLEMRATDLLAVVRAALDTVRPAASAKSISLSARLNPDAAHVYGDEERLQQVVWNLVNNAIKFTPKGGNIEVRVDRVGTSVELSVSDDGEGIATPFLPHVFERFRQADASTTRRHGGLGLGLALVRYLVEAHGGSVQAASDGPGRGATFTVRLPVQAVLAARADSEPVPALDHVPQLATGPNALTGRRVLVVDDEADARELISTVLAQHGAEVLPAASAEQALQQLGDHEPDLILSDVGMPAMDGYALIACIRAMAGKLSRIPAVALTAYAREEDKRRARQAGFDAYLSKPVEPAALAGIVESLTRRRAAE